MVITEEVTASVLLSDVSDAAVGAVGRTAGSSRRGGERSILVIKVREPNIVLSLTFHLRGIP